MARKKRAKKKEERVVEEQAPKQPAPVVQPEKEHFLPKAKEGEDPKPGETPWHTTVRK